MRKNYYLVAAAALFFALTISPAISYAAETTVLICDSILAGFKCELDNFYNLGKAGQEVKGDIDCPKGRKGKFIFNQSRAGVQQVVFDLFAASDISERAPRPF